MLYNACDMKLSKQQNAALRSAAFLMATSAVGPGFLTQTVTFSALFQERLTPVILCVIIMDIVTQLHIWQTVVASGMRAPEIAGRLCPYLGYVVALLAALGGGAFLVGNIGGLALGLSTLLNVPTRTGVLLGAGIVIALLIPRGASKAAGYVAELLGCCVVAAAVFLVGKNAPPLETVESSLLHIQMSEDLVSPLLTLLGGSCGGYIAFAGAHRLLDAGVTGVDALAGTRRSVLLGTLLSGGVRILLFLTTLGVCAADTPVVGEIAHSASPVLEVFFAVMGTPGRWLFGAVLTCTGLTTAMGASYTSISFLKIFHPVVQRFERLCTACFALIAAGVAYLWGTPTGLMLLAGLLNGAILPVMLTITLLAEQKPAIVGEDFHMHPLLRAAGIPVALAASFACILKLTALIHG